jgi:predicted enzyme related to lactoylglutathione lyase
MKQHLGLASVVVRDYDEAIQFYTQKLGLRSSGISTATCGTYSNQARRMLLFRFNFELQ